MLRDCCNTIFNNLFKEQFTQNINYTYFSLLPVVLFINLDCFGVSYLMGRLLSYSHIIFETRLKIYLYIYILLTLRCTVRLNLKRNLNYFSGIRKRNIKDLDLNHFNRRLFAKQYI